MEETKKINDQYLAAIEKQVAAAQETGDIPGSFSYVFNGKTWVLLLPQSAMAQKRLLALRNKYLANVDDFSAEEAFIRAIADNVQINGQPVKLNLLEYGEVEVMKLAYMDSLLLPLSLGGDKAVEMYMKSAAGAK